MGQRKRILFLTPRVPFPPDKGDKIRTFHQLYHLASRHAVYCACFVDTAEDFRHLPDLRRRCEAVLAVRWTKTSAMMRGIEGWLSGRSLSESAFADRDMMRKVRTLGDQIGFDATVAFSSCMAPYALAVRAGRRVLDMCDVDSQKWFDYAHRRRIPFSLLSAWEGRRLRRFEESCVERFDATLLITEKERRLLDPTSRTPNLHVIPNGTEPTAREVRPAFQCGPVIAFVGSMDYPPNAEGIRWFVRDVWPGIIREIASAKLWIVGRNPGRRVRNLARAPGVVVTGCVDDTRPYVARSRVIVAPLKIARGMPNKVLEAMAAGRPVVATTVAAEGLNARPGEHLLVAEDADQFATSVVSLCRCDELCRQVGEQGLRFVAAHHRWSEALRGYERVVIGQASTVAQELPIETRPGTLRVAAALTTWPSALARRDPETGLNPRLPGWAVGSGGQAERRRESKPSGKT